MLGAIGSGVSSFPADNGKASATLSSQLAKYQSQLADWSHCRSCKTPEGKAKIKEISDKIDEIKQQMKAADEARRSAKAADGAPNIASLMIGSNQTTGRVAPANRSNTVGSIGSVVNVFA